MSSDLDLIPKAKNVEGYPINLESTSLKQEEQKKKMMLVKCRSCAKSFDTTFTVQDFETLSRNQMESGTLHLCPQCGNLSLYVLKDYFEEK